MESSSIAAIAVFAVLVLTTIPGLVAVARQARDGKPRDRFYEDADGRSSPEDVARFSNRLIKETIVLFSVIGLGASIAVLVISRLHEHGSDLTNVLVVASWVSGIDGQRVNWG